jgi:hypothetical protein
VPATSVGGDRRVLSSTFRLLLSRCGKLKLGLQNGECGIMNAECGVRNGDCRFQIADFRLMISDFKNRKVDTSYSEIRDKEVFDLECGGMTPLSKGETRLAVQSADASAHSKNLPVAPNMRRLIHLLDCLPSSPFWQPASQIQDIDIWCISCVSWLKKRSHANPQSATADPRSEFAIRNWNVPLFQSFRCSAIRFS